MESEGSLNMKDLGFVEIVLPNNERKITTATTVKNESKDKHQSTIKFSENIDKKNKGAVFEDMECEEFE
jgi:hypothetical protein